MAPADASSSSFPISDADLRKAIFDLVRKVDLETTGVKKFTRLLSKELKCEELVTTSNKTEFIKSVLTDAIHQLQQEQGDEQEEEDSDSGDDESDSDDDGLKKKKTAGKKQTRTSGGGGSGSGGGLSQPKPISKELATFLGLKDPETAIMARKDIVKSLWAYIRDNDLQNPDNKREIILDDGLKRVFGCDSFTMFTMNKYIGAHVHPFKPVDLTTNSSSSTPSKRGKRKKRASAGSAASSQKKPRKTGAQPPYRLSEELQAVVGVEILPRPQVVSKLWEYIKAHDLQNPSDRREILCDEKLKRVFQNKKSVTMFNMNTFISSHLIEKVDRSEYTHTTAASHDEEDNEGDESDGDEESDT